MTYHIGLNKGHVCKTAGGLSLSPGIRILPVRTLISGLLHVGHHLLHVCSKPERLWSEEDNGAVGALAQQQADESTSWSRLT